MEQREIKRKLKQYAAECKKIVPVEKELQIQKLLQIENSLRIKDLTVDSISRTRGNLWNYVWEQIGYLGKYCLIWQTVWIALFWYMMRYGALQFFGENNENEVLVTISILSPILVLLTAEEVTKVYQRSMLEIEYATKYSLRSAVMIRMAALCVVHSLLLMICIICLHSRMESNLGRLLVYGFTPMLLVTGIVLKLMQYYQGDLLRSAAVGIYMLVAALAVIGNTGYIGWYQPDYFKVWCAVCAAGIVFSIRQFVRLSSKLASYEQIVQYE